MLVNEDDPVKAQLVDDRIQALITEANLILSQQISEQAAVYLDVLIEGGDFDIPLLGETSASSASSNAADDPRGGARRAAAGLRARPSSSTEVIRFAELARDNLDFALPLLGAVAEPIEVDKKVVAGDARRSTRSRSRSRRR